MIYVVVLVCFFCNKLYVIWVIKNMYLGVCNFVFNLNNLRVWVLVFLFYCFVMFVISLEIVNVNVGYLEIENK